VGNTEGVYMEAVGSGLYDKVTGLIGKYDNVRRYWEDEVTRICIRPEIARLAEEKLSLMERLRVLDLGCGSGDGYELLSTVKAKDAGLIDHQVNQITPENLGIYRGVDISEPLIEQARSVHGMNGKVRFDLGDFSGGLPVEEGEPPYDIYFTSFGTLSHLMDDELVRLLVDIAKHSGRRSVLICDWLGRYSYEWQDLWEGEEKSDYMMDYVVSYIYPVGEREDKELDHLRLRLMSDGEVRRLVSRAEEKAGVSINEKALFDRSILVGRHMDTGDYNRYCKPLRLAVNSLFEVNLRTNLEDLIADYNIRDGFDRINAFFEKYQMSWNALVRYTTDLLYHYDSDNPEGSPPEVQSTYPEIVRNMMHSMHNIVGSCYWISVGDTRANIIEPQLGYALREMEMRLQEGLGCGHGLVGIYEINK
jgi:SAM-dependent methyltransferase